MGSCSGQSVGPTAVVSRRGRPVEPIRDDRRFARPPHPHGVRLSEAAQAHLSPRSIARANLPGPTSSTRDWRTRRHQSPAESRWHDEVQPREPAGKLDPANLQPGLRSFRGPPDLAAGLPTSGVSSPLPCATAAEMVPQRHPETENDGVLNVHVLRDSALRPKSPPG